MRRATGPLLLAGVMLLLVACLVIHDSPAPGCIERLGPAPLGGCAGTTIITDLQVIPARCLDVAANNCNGGVLEVQNRCSEAAQLDGLPLPPDNSLSLDIVPIGSGYRLTTTAGNVALTVPTHTLRLTFTGTAAGGPLTVTFAKTAPLCP